MTFRVPTRPPREYDAGTFSRIFNRIAEAINGISGDVDDVRRVVRDAITPSAEEEDEGVIQGHVEWYQDTATSEYVGRLNIISGGVNLADADAQYRLSTDGNIKDIDVTGALTPIAPTELYEKRYEIRTPVIGRAGDSAVFVTIEITASNALGTWIRESHTFDSNRLPNMRSVWARTGFFNYTTGQFSILLDWAGDEETGAIDYYLSTTPFPFPLNDGHYATAIDGQIGYGSTLLNVAPSPVGSTPVTYYLAVRSRSGTIGAGLGLKGVVQHRIITIPHDPRDPSVLNAGSITANLLVESMRRAVISVSAAWTVGQENTSITYSGSIAYNDSTSYTVSGAISGAIGSAYQYVYFDPAVSTTTLQATTNITIAFTISGKRIFVGVFRPATVSGERAFHVFSNGVPVITAPYIYAASLAAITANMGSITAGQITIAGVGNTIWLNDGNDGGIAVGGTTKATAPFRVSADGAFHAGSATKYVDYNPSTGVLALVGEGTLQVGAVTLGANAFGTYPGLYLNADNYWVWNTGGAGYSVLRSGSGVSYITIDAGNDQANIRMGSAGGDHVFIGTDALGTGLAGLNVYDGVRSRFQAGEVASGVYGVRVYDVTGAVVLDTTAGNVFGTAGVTVPGNLHVSGGSIVHHEKVAEIADVTGTPKTVTTLSYTGLNTTLYATDRIYVKNVLGLWEEFTLTGGPYTAASGTFTVSSRTLNYNIDNGASPNEVYRRAVEIRSGGLYIGNRSGLQGTKIVMGDTTLAWHVTTATNHGFTIDHGGTESFVLQTLLKDIYITAGYWVTVPPTASVYITPGGGGGNVVLSNQKFPRTAGTAGFALTTNGTDAVWAMLGVAGGGTGKTTWTANQLVYASGTTTLAQLSVGTGLQINGTALQVASTTPQYHSGAYGGAPGSGVGKAGDIAYDADLGGIYIKGGAGWVKVN